MPGTCGSTCWRGICLNAELGDARRFGNSSDAVRHTGLDITVYSSDSNRSAGHLSRQSPQLPPSPMPIHRESVVLNA